MALTEDRLRRVETEGGTRGEVESAPSAAELEAMLGTAATATLTPPSYKGLLVAWLGGLTFLFAFAPAPDDASVPLWAAVLSVGFLSALFATVTALAARRSWALRASALTAGSGMAIAGACAQTGHHAGTWWAVEFAVFAGLLALTARASVRGRSRAS